MHDHVPLPFRFSPRGSARGNDVELRTISRRSLLAAGASAMVGPWALGRITRHRPIILGQVSLSFYAVTGAVVHEVLERLGHSVEVRPKPHEEMFPLLGQSAIDLMAAVWLPEGHAAYWARYGVGAEEVARLYDGARFFWAVPDYVPESEVTSIADLGKPSVADRMTKLIQGIGTGATITTVSQKAVRDYGLDARGYSLRPGTPAEWTSAYDAAVAEGRWIVFPDLGAAIPQPWWQAPAAAGSAWRPWRHQPRRARRASGPTASDPARDASSPGAHRSRARRRHRDGLARQRREKDAS
jgi:hypothetical protein